MAQGRALAAGARGAGGRLCVRGQAVRGRRAPDAEAGGGRADAPRPQRPDRRAAGAGRRLRTCPDRVAVVQRDARHGVRAGGPARRAQHRDLHPRPAARTQPALPSGPPDRRRQQSARPRAVGGGEPAGADAVQRRADPSGGDAGQRHPVAAVQSLVCGHGDRGDPGLRQLHLHGHRSAGGVAPRDEPSGQPGRGHRGGQPDQLRDGEVFRRRTARTRPLRRRQARLRTVGGEEPGHPVGAEHRPEPDHVGRADDRAVAWRRWARRAGG